MRQAFGLSTLLLTAAVPPSMARSPDVIEAGRVMATLDDWRAILFVALVLVALMLAALLTVVVLAFRAQGKSAEAQGKVAEGLVAVREAISSTNLVLARLESRGDRHVD